MEGMYLRLEVEGMRHTIVQMLADYSGKQQEQIKAAIEAACTPENIERVICDTATAAIKAAVAQEVERFYSYGAGRKVIRESVEKQLTRDD